MTKLARLVEGTPVNRLIDALGGVVSQTLFNVEHIYAVSGIDKSLIEPSRVDVTGRLRFLATVAEGHVNEKQRKAFYGFCRCLIEFIEVELSSHKLDDRRRVELKRLRADCRVVSKKLGS